MHVQYAKFIEHRCPLADENCFKRVVSHYTKFLCAPDENEIAKVIDAKIPRYVRGAKKGLRKGTASIKVCTEGGWKRLGEGEGNGKVVFPGAIVGVWLGISNGFEFKTFASVGNND